jgi:hypothetical protein
LKPVDNVIIADCAFPLDEEHRSPEVGNHDSGNKPELSLVFCACARLFLKDFPLAAAGCGTNGNNLIKYGNALIG